MNSDFKEMLSILNARKVRYLIVGGGWRWPHGEPEPTWPAGAT